MNQVLDPVTMVYHELRAPLGLMATAARSVAEDAPDADLRARAETIVRVAERMLRTANQVFQLNRAAQANEPSSFLPAETVAEIAASFRIAGHAVDVHGTAGALEAVQPQFEALVHSLISNAVDHFDPAVPITVAIEDGESLVIRIENTIARAPRTGGLGLGTAIADGLAERLGVEITRVREGERYLVKLRFPARGR